MSCLFSQTNSTVQNILKVVVYRNDTNTLTVKILPYFSAYKTESFPFQNNRKNLDPSYKMDLDLCDCL